MLAPETKAHDILFVSIKLKNNDTIFVYLNYVILLKRMWYTHKSNFGIPKLAIY